MKKYLFFIFIFISFFPIIATSQYLNPYSGFMEQALLQQQQVLRQQQAMLNDLTNERNKIERSVEYKSVNGESGICIVHIIRNNGLSNVKAYVSSENSNKTMRLEVIDCYSSVQIYVGEKDWTLNYGDVITVTCDQASTWKYTVGIDDNFSEPDWNQFIQNKIVAARDSKLNESPAFTNTGVIPIFNPSSDINNQQTTVKRKCGYCNGTGWINDNSVPDFGTGSKWCEACGKMVPASHCHGCKRCPSCGGKGYY